MDNNTKVVNDIKFEANYLPFRCPVCNGFGTLKYGEIKCQACEGKGYVVVEQKYSQKDRQEGNYDKANS